jgi:hypothetical protein
MNTLTADPTLQQSLSGLSGLTQVRDARGNVLGYYSPASQKSADAYARAAAHFDPEEMKQRKLAQEKGRTTSEVLSRFASAEG